MNATQAILAFQPKSPAIVGQAPMDSKDIAGDILRRQSQMEADRANFDNLWQEIATYVAPQMNFTVKREAGFRQGTDIFDSTPELASDRFAAAIQSILTPAGQTWHLLKPVNEDLADDTEVKRWGDEVNKRLFSMRYSPRSNFAPQIHEVYKSLGDFGTGALFSEEMPQGGLCYRSCNLAGLYIVEDVYGRVSYCHYKLELTAEQAAQRFGESNLPDLVKSKVKDRPDDKATYIHCVRPNYNRIQGIPGVKGMAFESWWVCKDARQVVGKGGFRTFPYAVSRYVMRSGEVYGRSPAMMALADILMLNTMGQTMIQAQQISLAPPLLAPHDGVMSALGDGISMEPFAINWGGVDPASGNQLVHPLNIGANFRPVETEIQARRQSINAAFLVTLFQILVETPAMTATEALLRAQEKGALLAPVAGRQQSELLGPVVNREIDLLMRAGALPPPPRIMLESGEGWKLEYDSPLTRAMKADQGVGLLRTIEALTPLARVDPSVLDVFNPDEVGPGLADINGVPSKWIRSKEELAAVRDGRKQALQAQQLIDGAPAIAGSIKDIAQAQQAATTPRF